jgi:hypothetical protein
MDIHLRSILLAGLDADPCLNEPALAIGAS